MRRLDVHNLQTNIAIRRGEENIPEDAILEVSLATKALMVEISAEIEHIGGLGVIIDYGYIKNPLTSTLQAVKNHKKCDILENIGNCDISSLVNFKLLENIAKKNKLQTSLISQRKFLLDLGIQQRLDNIKENKDKIKLEVERLINKKQMGELFKVLIFWK